MSALESLLAEHRLILSELFTQLSHNPLELLSSHLTQLQTSLSHQIILQRQSAQEQVDNAVVLVQDRTVKLEQWLTALGELGGTGGVTGSNNNNNNNNNHIPLLSQLTIIDDRLDAIRDKMKSRAQQILALQQQLFHLTPLLGIAWLKVEIPQGGIEYDQADDTWEGIDLTLDRLSALERELVRCQAEISHRREIIHANVNEIFAIRSELGIHQSTSSSPSSTILSSSATTANDPPSDPFDELILCHLGVGELREQKEMLPTEENLLRVEARRKWLEEEKDHRNTLIQTTYDKLHPLWSMLGVSDAEMETFVEKWMGSTSDVVNAYQVELARMLTLKRSNLSTFILLERESLTTLWDTLYLSPPQRLASFPPFAICVTPTLVWNAAHGVEEEVVNENVSEELLVAHEREREKWEGEVEGARGVLERLDKYFGVVEEMRELEASASDPSRLLGKSTRGDPGRLLREEKARKRVVKDKPKLETELRKFIPTWEAQHGRPFLVNGKRFLDDLEEKLEAELMEKELKKRPKNTTVPLASTSSQNRTVPLRAQHTGSAALRAQHTGASSASSSTQQQQQQQERIKRQNTGGPGKVPAGKRVLISSHPTGNGAGTTTRNVLSESSNSVLSSTSSTGRSSGTIGGGMKIPAGWGGDSTSGVSAYPTKEEERARVTVPLVPQYTGFRPMTSARLSRDGNS